MLTELHCLHSLIWGGLWLICYHLPLGISRLRPSECFATSHRANEQISKNRNLGFILLLTASRPTASYYPTLYSAKENVGPSQSYLLHESCPGHSGSHGPSPNPHTFFFG